MALKQQGKYTMWKIVHSSEHQYVTPDAIFDRNATLLFNNELISSAVAILTQVSRSDLARTLCENH
jgi:hypothetical protein